MKVQRAAANGGGRECYWMRGRFRHLIIEKAATIVLSGIGCSGRNIRGDEAAALGDAVGFGLGYRERPSAALVSAEPTNSPLGCSLNGLAGHNKNPRQRRETDLRRHPGLDWDYRERPAGRTGFC